MYQKGKGELVSKAVHNTTRIIISCLCLYHSLSLCSASDSKISEPSCSDDFKGFCIDIRQKNAAVDCLYPTWRANCREGKLCCIPKLDKEPKGESKNLLESNGDEDKQTSATRKTRKIAINQRNPVIKQISERGSGEVFSSRNEKKHHSGFTTKKKLKKNKNMKKKKKRRKNGKKYADKAGPNRTTNGDDDGDDDVKNTISKKGNEVYKKKLRAECKKATGNKKCRAGGGVCKNKCKGREHVIDAGCGTDSCKCCVKPCKEKNRCLKAGGTCLRTKKDCTGKIIAKGCKGKVCVCCLSTIGEDSDCTDAVTSVTSHMKTQMQNSVLVLERLSENLGMRTHISKTVGNSLLKSLRNLKDLLQRIQDKSDKLELFLKSFKISGRRAFCPSKAFVELANKLSKKNRVLQRFSEMIKETRRKGELMKVQRILKTVSNLKVYLQVQLTQYVNVIVYVTASSAPNPGTSSSSTTSTPTETTTSTSSAVSTTTTTSSSVSTTTSALSTVSTTTSTLTTVPSTTYSSPTSITSSVSTTSTPIETTTSTLPTVSATTSTSSAVSTTTSTSSAVSTTTATSAVFTTTATSSAVSTTTATSSAVSTTTSSPSAVSTTTPTLTMGPTSTSSSPNSITSTASTTSTPIESTTSQSFTVSTATSTPSTVSATTSTPSTASTTNSTLDLFSTTTIDFQ